MGSRFSPDGQWLATSSRDKTVRIWRLSDGHCRVLTGHTSDVHRCAFSPDSKWLATASQDATVRVWNVTAGTCTTKLQGAGIRSTGLPFLPTETQLAAVGDDFMLRVWSTDGFGPSFSSDSRRAALYAVTFCRNGQGLAVGGADCTVRLWSERDRPPVPAEAGGKQPHTSGQPGQCPLQRGQAFVGLLLREDKRRRDADDVAVDADGADQQTVRCAVVDQRPDQLRRRLLGAFVVNELESHHQTHATHIAQIGAAGRDLPAVAS